MEVVLENALQVLKLFTLLEEFSEQCRPRMIYDRGTVVAMQFDAINDSRMVTLQTSYRCKMTGTAISFPTGYVLDTYRLHPFLKRRARAAYKLRLVFDEGTLRARALIADHNNNDLWCLQQIGMQSPVPYFQLDSIGAMKKCQLRFSMPSKCFHTFTLRLWLAHHHVHLQLKPDHHWLLQAWKHRLSIQLEFAAGQVTLIPKVVSKKRPAAGAAPGAAAAQSAKRQKVGATSNHVAGAGGGGGGGHTTPKSAMRMEINEALSGQDLSLGTFRMKDIQFATRQYEYESRLTLGISPGGPLILLYQKTDPLEFACVHFSPL